MRKASRSLSQSDPSTHCLRSSRVHEELSQSGDLDLCEFAGTYWRSEFLLLSVCSEIRLELSLDSGSFVIVAPYEIDTEKLVRMESVK